MDEAILILKPGFDKYKDYINEYAANNDMTVMAVIEKVLNRSDIVCLYPDIFRTREDDSDYGEEWKQDTINYLTSNSSCIYYIHGYDAINKMRELKYKLRLDEGKCVKPPTRLSRREFIDISIKNVIHTVDNEEMGHIKWLFGFIGAGFEQKPNSKKSRQVA